MVLEVQDMKKQQHAIQFDPEVMDKLKIIANQEGRSISNLVNKICQEYVNRRDD